MLILRGALADRLENRIVAQALRIIAVFVPQGDLVEPLAHLLQTIMRHLQRIAPVGQQAGNPRRQPQSIIHLAQQHGPPIGGDVR